MIKILSVGWLLFQFPSNGKVYPKSGRRTLHPLPQRWFQFPSNGKVYPKAILPKNFLLNLKFQFPSNGKVYPKVIETRGNTTETTLVSIPFKRESISKGSKDRQTALLSLSFNSLQTGKYIQRRIKADGKVKEMRKFQFPSNGKVYPKERSS